ncbi:MAG: beta-mannanase [Clostridia bacterium]|nr:beta-mannanase [Clostridia bacterium]
MKDTLYAKEPYLIGCNYWASHAGVYMWRQWDEAVVEADFRQLAENGLTTVRVFPLWDDFQPVAWLHSGPLSQYELAHGDKGLDDPLDGDGMLDPVMLERFGRMLDLAEKYGLQLIVGLLTGWMSGRQFFPAPLEGKNLLSDPSALFFELKFIEGFVGRFKHHPAIVAWNPGNECNTMGRVDREQAWLWLRTVTDAIRVQDPTRPVVAGMHGLGIEGTWRITDVADSCDYLTTHPYNPFVPYCDLDKLGSMRSVLHSVAESLFYADIGGKPCFVEEIGSLSPMFGDEKTVCGALQAQLYSTWAHGVNGLLWWCAYDQDALDFAPYDWCAIERELGLFRADRTPKGRAQVMADFRRFAEEVGELPAHTTDGVCILTEGADPNKAEHWQAAFGSFLLAKQAGIDLTYVAAGQPLPEKDLYILPSIKGYNVMKKRHFDRLLRRVQEGATLLITCEDGCLPHFETLCGLRSKGMQADRGGRQMHLGDTSLPIITDKYMTLEPTTATVLAADGDGNPVFTVNTYGKGKVYFLDMPLELARCATPTAFEPGCDDYAAIYRTAAAQVRKNRVVKTCLHLGLTEHPLSDTRRLVVAVNYTGEAITDTLTPPTGWQFTKAIQGALPTDRWSIEPHGCQVWEMCKV